MGNVCFGLFCCFWLYYVLKYFYDPFLKLVLHMFCIVTLYNVVSSSTKCRYDSVMHMLCMLSNTLSNVYSKGLLLGSQMFVFVL